MHKKLKWTIYGSHAQMRVDGTWQKLTINRWLRSIWRHWLAAMHTHSPAFLRQLASFLAVVISVLDLWCRGFFTGAMNTQGCMTLLNACARIHRSTRDMIQLTTPYQDQNPYIQRMWFWTPNCRSKNKIVARDKIRSCNLLLRIKQLSHRGSY